MNRLDRTDDICRTALGCARVIMKHARRNYDGTNTKRHYIPVTIQKQSKENLWVDEEMRSVVHIAARLMPLLNSGVTGGGLIARMG